MTARRVLVVEDETLIAQVIRLYLEREGYQVTVAGDGAAALDAVRRSGPDLIVLDIGLPDGRHRGLPPAARRRRLDPGASS